MLALDLALIEISQPCPSRSNPTLFLRKSVSSSKDPMPFPVPIADHIRGHNQGATGHFVRRFARAAPLPYRGLHAART